MVLLAHHIIGDSGRYYQDLSYELVDINEKEGEYGYTRHAFEFDDTETIMGK